MSDDWIRVIPEDPRFVPDAARQARARAFVARIAPNAYEVEIKISDTIQFFDCGGNFERIVCPSCQTELPMEWWGQRMDEDYDGGFKLSKYPAPCCGTHLTLHELLYEWPQGFGRFVLDVMNPEIGELRKKDRQELAEILGVPIRIIIRHL